MAKLKSKPQIHRKETDTVIEQDDEKRNLANINFDITSYGADYDVRGLVRRVTEGELELPDFQRGNVWKSSQKQLLIDSFLRGLPVPGIFLAKDPHTQKYDIIDGQQRLQTLLEFYNDNIILRDDRVLSECKDLKYSMLPPQFRRKLDNALLHAIIIESKNLKHSGIHDLFSRINTSSTPLNPQEIRTALNGGSFNQMLKNLNDDSNWRMAFGKEHTRLKDRELILRFLALTYNLNNYKPTMTDFLDDFMSENRFIKDAKIKAYRKIFSQTIEKLTSNLGADVFKPKKALVITVFDALAVGLARAILAKKVIKDSEIANRVQILKKSHYGYMYGIEKFTSDEDRMSARIEAAFEVFSTTETQLKKALVASKKEFSKKLENK